MILKDSSESAVKAWVTAGYHNGDWLGSTGITSSVAASDAHHLTAVGYGANSALNKSSFAGVSGLASTDVLVNCVPQGDADLSGQASLDDYTLFMAGLQGTAALGCVATSTTAA
jgi:hypothetical protein